MAEVGLAGAVDLFLVVAQRERGGGLGGAQLRAALAVGVVEDERALRWAWALPSNQYCPG
ncbi:hypothetical protein LBM2029_19210 (plasmid) [Ralstonia solanacearum]|nr:hypothetical protein LBM2029_19210 [Ralstonia solanacearum]